MLPPSISSLPSPGHRDRVARGFSGAFWDPKEEALLQGEQPPFPHVNQKSKSHWALEGAGGRGRFSPGLLHTLPLWTAAARMRAV